MIIFVAQTVIPKHNSDFVDECCLVDSLPLECTGMQNFQRHFGKTFFVAEYANEYFS